MSDTQDRLVKVLGDLDAERIISANLRKKLAKALTDRDEWKRLFFANHDHSWIEITTHDDRPGERRFVCGSCKATKEENENRD